ncbi:MAG: sulfur carrier protein ThiS [Pyrinomonadaceae bacterium]
MEIMLNGEPRKISGELTLAQLIDHFELPKQRVAVELNRNVVRRVEWETTKVANADRIEVIHFVGGG